MSKERPQIVFDLKEIHFRLDCSVDNIVDDYEKYINADSIEERGHSLKGNTEELKDLVGDVGDLVVSVETELDGIRQSHKEILLPSPSRPAKMFEEARVRLAGLLAEMEGLNDSDVLGVSDIELQIIMGHLRASAAMLQDHFITRGLLDETREKLSVLDRTGPYIGVLGAVLSLLGLLSKG